MKTSRKREKKICKKGIINAPKKYTSQKEGSKPMVSGFYRRLVYGNSDKESSHVVGNSFVRG